MRKLYSLIFILPVLSAYVKADNFRVLFLGNSYTYENNLPQLLKDIAANRGDTLIYDMNAPGGFTLGQHSDNTTTKAKLQLGNWDYVVLQEQSQIPSWDNYTPSESIELNHMVRETNPCARLMFYMTWGRKNGDADNCGWWPPVCTYKGMDSMLRLRYIEMADVNHAPIAAVGAAWRYVRENYPSIELYQADESHPSLAGSYLAACCFYTSIFKKDPSQISINFSLNSTVAANIRTAVKKAVFDVLPSWDFSKPRPEAKFSYQVEKGHNKIVVHNHSERADSYRWEFGDGNVSTLKDDVHSFTNNGKYTVRLIAINCELGVQYKDTQELDVNFCDYDLSIYPENLVLCAPYDDTIWTQEYDSYQWFRDGDSLEGENRRFFPVYPGEYTVAVSKNGCAELSYPVTVSTHHSLQFYFTEVHGPVIGQLYKACIGDTLILVAAPNKPPLPENERISWYKGGVELTGFKNDSLIVTETGMYTVKIKNAYCEGFFDFVDSNFIEFIHCPLGLGEEQEESSIRLYPNPAEDLLRIELPVTVKSAWVVITDVCGRMIRQVQMSDSKENIDISELEAGIYFVSTDAGTKPGIFIKR